MAAEPVVAFGQRRLRLGRSLASGVGVTLTLLLVFGLLTILGAVAVRQVGALAEKLPDLSAGAEKLEDLLMNAAHKAPEKLRPLAENTVRRSFEGGSVLAGKVPALLTSLVSGLGSSLLGIGTGLLSAFFISARLPQLRKWTKSHLPPSWEARYLPALKRGKSCLSGWLKAQGKLMLVSFGILSAGFWLLQVKNPFLLGGLTALVDAVPVLGTGTVLLPWAAVSLLQGQNIRALGLVGLWGAAAIARVILEPRLVGRHLGLDPLWTLVAMYAGFRLFGIPGLLLTPILASAVRSMFLSPRENP